MSELVGSTLRCSTTHLTTCGRSAAHSAHRTPRTAHRTQRTAHRAPRTAPGAFRAHRACARPTPLRCPPHRYGGVLSVPTSSEELSAELQAAFTFNSFTLEEAADLLSGFSFADNPTIIYIIVVILVSNLLTVIYLGLYRGYRNRLRRRRENKSFEIERTQDQVWSTWPCPRACPRAHAHRRTHSHTRLVRPRAVAGAPD